MNGMDPFLKKLSKNKIGVFDRPTLTVNITESVIQ